MKTSLLQSNHPACLCISLSLLAAALAFHVSADAANHTAPATAGTSTRTEGAAAPSTAPKAEAEVRRVDGANARIQLRHGPIPNLDMPPMTMVFRVRDVSWLEGLKEGDRILFTAEKIDGQYTVTSLERRP